MRAAAADAWTALLLMSLINVVVPDTTTNVNIQPKKKPNNNISEKSSGNCGNNELGICRTVDYCSGAYIDWPKGRNKCSKGEKCCRRTTSFGCTTENGKTCKFPFKYNNEWYEDCTTVDADPGKAWCSYQQDDDGNHIKGKYGICKSICKETRCMECDTDREEDQFFMHPYDCSKFMKCNPNGAKELSCPTGTHWDQSALACGATTQCVTANYINKDGSCKTEESMCQRNPGCKQKYITCRKLMCGTMPSKFLKHMKECAAELEIELPEKEEDHDHVMGDSHNHTHHEVHLCARPFRPKHPRRDGLMQRLDSTDAAMLRKCILNRSHILKSWDDLVNRGVMLAKLYPAFLDYPELQVPIKDAIENTCQEPVDYDIHDFYGCVHKTCIEHIVLQTT